MSETTTQFNAEECQRILCALTNSGSQWTDLDLEIIAKARTACGLGPFGPVIEDRLRKFREKRIAREE